MCLQNFDSPSRSGEIQCQIMADNSCRRHVTCPYLFSASLRLVLDTDIAASKIEKKIWKYLRQWNLYQREWSQNFGTLAQENEPEKSIFWWNQHKIVSQGSNRAPMCARKNSTISRWKGQYLRAFNKFIWPSKISFKFPVSILSSSFL